MMATIGGVVGNLPRNTVATRKEKKTERNNRRALKLSMLQFSTVTMALAQPDPAFVTPLPATGATPVAPAMTAAYPAAPEPARQAPEQPSSSSDVGGSYKRSAADRGTSTKALVEVACLKCARRL